MDDSSEATRKSAREPRRSAGVAAPRLGQGDDWGLGRDSSWLSPDAASSGVAREPAGLQSEWQLQREKERRLREAAAAGAKAATEAKAQQKRLRAEQLNWRSSVGRSASERSWPSGRPTRRSSCSSLAWQVVGTHTGRDVSDLECVRPSGVAVVADACLHAHPSDPCACSQTASRVTAHANSACSHAAPPVAGRSGLGPANPQSE